MNINWSTIALVGCQILLLVACNQISAPPMIDETFPSSIATLPSIDAQMGPAPTIPTHVPTTRPSTVVEPTETQRGTVGPISPTQAVVEDNAMSESQNQLLLGDESTESVKLAKQDLAQRLGISVDSILVAVVIGQKFSTDAFNCRISKERIAMEEPPQVVLGHNILLSASGHRYEYHASGQTVIFCRPIH